MSAESDRRTKPLTSANFYILFALADGEQHGLGVAEEIAERTGGEVELGPGTLYNALQRLENAGMIEESTGRSRVAKADSRRRYYRITPVGRDTLRTEAGRLSRIVDAVFEKRILTRGGIV